MNIKIKVVLAFVGLLLLTSCGTDDTPAKAERQKLDLPPYEEVMPIGR